MERQIGLIVLALVGMGWVTWTIFQKKKLDNKKTEHFEITQAPCQRDLDPIPEVGQGDGLGRDCIVRAPWGETMTMRFSPEQWDMIKALSVCSGDSVEEIVCQIAGDKFLSGGGGGFLPPPPLGWWF